MATKKFKCKVCGYVHEGDKAPEQCPMCQAPQSEFEEIVEAGAEPAAPAKKGLNTNSNVYTIVYAAVMVIIVAFLLVFVSQTLKERQTANVINDTKQQILSALNLRDLPDVAGTYDQVIKSDALMATDGKLTEYDGEFNTSYKAEADNGNLHVFVAEIEGQKKYVIPMNGLGLWGTIWGYIALNEDRNTVYGVYFSHSSETPGLGGEIAGLKFQERFPGKEVVNGSEVGLKVVKFGKADQNSKFEVDGVTGATITSTGVNSMINKVLSAYIPFLTKQCCKEGGCEEGADECCDENSND
ncbi:MAG: NADH:ubiquinone reductase (Na(+)-transporting) subunit C [Bacteroidaceae bacterium]|nr:NADH:ubiquinone reductase (Na(+)-transporting) subunit C [Bacteroidaceae bacterium]